VLSFGFTVRHITNSTVYLSHLLAVMMQDSQEVKTVPHAMWDAVVDHPIDAFFTRDYSLGTGNMNDNRQTVQSYLGGPLGRGRTIKQVGVQGGFFVVRPSRQVFDEFISIILDGHNYTEEWGWGGEEVYYGHFWGASRIQGILAYYYGHIRPNTSVELNPCYYNNIQFPQLYNGKCVTGHSRKECQDCQKTDASKIFLAHFTKCGKPWTCRPFYVKSKNCMHFFKEWHGFRAAFQEELATNSSMKIHDNSYSKNSQGNCRKVGKYQPIVWRTPRTE
jgi:hypothetical protein